MNKITVVNLDLNVECCMKINEKGKGIKDCKKNAK